MGEALIVRRGGESKPKQPTGWTFLQLLTSNGSWTVPENGWYRVYCVGKSGNGGNGGNTFFASSSNQCNGGGGAGGSSGGVAISTLYIRKGVTIPVTVTTAVSSFGNYHSATAGANGGAGQPGISTSSGGDAGIAGAVGQGLGGNLLNSTGIHGGNGGTGNQYGTGRRASNGSSSGGNAGGTTDGQGGGGGGGADLQSLGGYYLSANKYGGNGAYQNSTDGFSCPPLTTPARFYGGGGGGGGAGNGTQNRTGKAGGLGSPGGIIIEVGT